MIYTIYHSREFWKKPTALGLVLGLIAFMVSIPLQTSQLLLLGILIGFVFIHFGFGFTGSWQQFIEKKQSAGIRGHLWLLGLGSILFFPALTLLPELGYSVHGAIRPVGANVAFGAFIFGIGMALAGTCSSGALRQIGEFKARFYWVFICMIIGGTFAASQFDFWIDFSQWGVFSFAREMTWPLGILINLSIIFALYIAFSKIEKQQHSQVSPLFDRQNKEFTWGIAPVIWAAVLTVILSLGVLVLSGNTWAVSWIFPKLGIVAIQQLELAIDWDFWEFTAMNETGLLKPLAEDKIFLTSLGFFIGVAIYHIISLIAHSPTKNRKTKLERFTLTTLLKTSVAGLLMGYGAVIAYGCNIGGFFSAIISGSLHGWLWFACAFIGMALTLKIKKQFSQ